jgi:hypothetical protein
LSYREKQKIFISFAWHFLSRGSQDDIIHLHRRPKHNQRDFFCFPSARKSQLVLQFFLGKVDAKKINAIINIYGKNQVTHQVIKLKCSTN